MKLIKLFLKLIFIITSIITINFNIVLAHNICYMPPLSEKQTLKYNLFMNKKLEDLENKLNTNQKKMYFLGESKPYENLKPALGVHNILILLVDFNDKPYHKLPLKYQSKNYYEEFLFNENLLSLNRYFKEASHNKLKFQGKVLNVNPNKLGNDMYWYKSKRLYIDWATDNLDYIDSYDISMLAFEVIDNAKNYFNFSVYDTNQNGHLEPEELHIVIFHSGSGQEFTGNTSDIWSHRSILEVPVKANNVLIDSYMLLASDSSLGVLCHEMGHELGLYDIYDVNTGQPVLGSWTLMDRGAWNGAFPKQAGSTPALLSAYERMLLGWIKPTEIKNEKVQLYLRCPSSKNNDIKTLNGYLISDALKYTIPNTNNKEYVLVENRFKVKNSFDEDLPPLFKRENGMVAYYINENMPDKTKFYYINSSKNSDFKVKLLLPLNSSFDFAYFNNEFSKYTIDFKKINKNILDNFNLRINCIGSIDEFTLIAINQILPSIDKYEINISKDIIDINVLFTNFNYNQTKLSAYLISKSNLDETNNLFKLLLFENELITSTNFQKKLSLNPLKILNKTEYFLELVLKDGEYYTKKILGPYKFFTSNNYQIKVFPEVINKGEVIINVYSSKNELNKLNVSILYNDKFNQQITNDISMFNKKQEEMVDIYEYRFLVTDDICSDITLKVNYNDSEYIKKIQVIRDNPIIKHSIYNLSSYEDLLTFFIESDRKLLKAKINIYEKNYETTSIDLLSHSSNSNIYYCNYQIKNSNLITYSIECVDLAGNSCTLNNGSTIYKFKFLPGKNYFVNENTTFEININSNLQNLFNRSIYLIHQKDNLNKSTIYFLPKDYENIDLSSQSIYLNAFLNNKQCLIKDKNNNLLNFDLNFKSFKLLNLSSYFLYEKNENQNNNLNNNTNIKSYIVPNPVKNNFKIIISDPKNLTSSNKSYVLKIYNSNMILLDKFEIQNQSLINTINYSNGVYFYSIENEYFKDKGKIVIKR